MYAGPILSLLALAVGIAGCAPPSSGDLELGWRFADGRRCAEAGASQIAATVDGAMVGPALGWQCQSGEGGSSVQLTGVAFGGDQLVVEARSGSGTTLYRGAEILASPPPPALLVTLYFIGGS